MHNDLVCCIRRAKWKTENISCDFYPIALVWHLELSKSLDQLRGDKSCSRDSIDRPFVK